MKKQMLTVLAICLLAGLCACGGKGGGEAARTVEVTVDYSAVDGFFEIGQDIIVTDAADETAAPLRMIKCVPNGTDYVYEFRLPGAELPKELRVSTPMLFQPAEIAPVSAPLKEGETAQLNGADWLRITALKGREISEGRYEVAVTVEAAPRSAIPRKATLCIGETRMDYELSDMRFEGDGSLKTVEMRFAIKADAGQDALKLVEGASLEVSEVLLRKIPTAEELKVSVDPDSVAVRVVDTVYAD